MDFIGKTLKIKGLQKAQYCFFQISEPAKVPKNSSVIKMYSWM